MSQTALTSEASGIPIHLSHAISLPWVEPDVVNESFREYSTATLGNRVYVADDRHPRIWAFGPDGELATAWGEQGYRQGHFHHVIGHLVPAEDRLLAIEIDGEDVVDPRIQAFDGDGQYLGRWDGPVPDLSSGELSLPRQSSYGGSSALTSEDEPVRASHWWQVDLGPNGELAIADINNRTVDIFDPDGNHRLAVGMNHDPWGLAFSSNGYLWIGEDDRITQYDHFGTEMASIPLEQAAFGQQLDILPSGDLLIALSRLVSVQPVVVDAPILIVSPDGIIKHEWRPMPGSESGYSVAAAPDDTVFVLENSSEPFGVVGYSPRQMDDERATVRRFSVDGTEISRFEIWPLVDSECSSWVAGARFGDRWHSFDGVTVLPGPIVVVAVTCSQGLFQPRIGALFAFDLDGTHVDTHTAPADTRMMEFLPMAPRANASGQLAVTEVSRSIGAARVHVLVPDEVDGWRVTSYNNEGRFGFPSRSRLEITPGLGLHAQRPESHRSDTIYEAAPVVPADGTYRIALTADVGVRLWIDEHLLVDEWSAGEVEYESERLMAARRTPIRVETRFSDQADRVDLAITLVDPEINQIFLPSTLWLTTGPRGSDVALVAKPTVVLQIAGN